MDALSVTASVIAVIQAAQAVISICCDYRSSVKGSSWEVSRILEETRSLRSILQNLEGLVDKAETQGSAEQSRLPALRSLCDPDTGILNSCYAELEKLTRKLAPPGWSGPAGSKRRGLVEALSWPLKKKDTEKILDSITRYKDTISIAVNADQIGSILAIEDATQETKVSFNLLKNDTHGQNVRNWLHAIDAHPKYTKTIEDRLSGTGAWLSKDHKFDDWKKGCNSRLWLYGIPGCGKTVLCSTAIENVLVDRSIATDKAIGVGYFYFDFNNRDQQYCDTMLRSLICQLWVQDRENANAVDALYLACGSGGSQPSSKMPRNTLKELVQSFVDAFIILDALDECKERDRLMPSIEEMAAWNISSLHMLVTSRKESDIETSLSTILDDEQRICIQSALVEDDIRKYIQSRIRSDYGLRKWRKPEVQTEIETVLMGKAGGMFQWVKCQLDALGRCLSLSSLRKALRSLPKDLDDTYARILQSIEDDEHSKLVATVVQWLAYSREPMSIAEISEVLTVDLDDDHQFDVERRLEDPQDLLRICSSFVTTVTRTGDYGPAPGSNEILQFAHFSVREYLESSRIHDGPAKRYAIQEIHSHTFIAESCIIYLLSSDVRQKRTDDDYLNSQREESPLAEYAASNWLFHAERAEEGGNIIALSKAFLGEVHRHPRWAECEYVVDDWYLDSQGNYLPLLHALWYNVLKITSALILEGADVNAPNKQGMTPWFGTLIHEHERMELIQLLLNHRADVNARDETGLTAVMLAAICGKLQTLRTLLDYGADPRAHYQDTEDTALTFAMREGYSSIVEHLLDRGVSISSHSVAEAIDTASYDRNYETLRIILARGVDVNAELHQPRSSGPFMYTSNFTTALLRALDSYDEWAGNDITDLLLEFGADVNARSTFNGKHGVALDHALNSGQDSMVEYLLEHGADSSLVKPEHLTEIGMECYEEMLQKIQDQNRSLHVHEEETEEAVADA